MGGVEYGFRDVGILIPGFPSLNMKTRNERERGLFHIRYGINYNKQLTPQFYLKSGLRVGTAGYKYVMSEDLRWPSGISNPGSSPGIDIKKLEIYYKFRFIELPMMARYEWNQKKWIPFIEFGIAPTIYLDQVLVKNHEPSSDERKYDGYLGEINTLHFTGIISVGMQYKLSDSYQIFGQPTYRYHFTKLTDTRTSDFLYNAGLEFGIRQKW